MTVGACYYFDETFKNMLSRGLKWLERSIDVFDRGPALK